MDHYCNSLSGAFEGTLILDPYDEGVGHAGAGFNMTS